MMNGGSSAMSAPLQFETKPISRGTESSNPVPSTRESGEIGGSSRSVAHRHL
jgi:hypothetical protein